ncbi:MAG: hypothetical protein HY718_03535 [Planctomycetes bacterium]|nr:hypothetical protein [Planctomycetota bacterium]
MIIAVICPNLMCRGILQVPETVRGRRVRCGKCGKDFMVPLSDKAKTTSGSTSPAPEGASAEAKP